MTTFGLGMLIVSWALIITLTSTTLYKVLRSEKPS